MQLPCWGASSMLDRTRWFPGISCCYGYLLLSTEGGGRGGDTTRQRHIGHSDTQRKKQTKTGHPPKKAQIHSKLE